MKSRTASEEAPDRDAAGGSRDETAVARDAKAQTRDRIGSGRDRASEYRDEAADLRDTDSDNRDRVADLRDAAGDRRDVEADLRDKAAEEVKDDSRPASSVGVLEQLHRLRAEAAFDRAVSADDRVVNAEDRAHSALQRQRAERDRSFASKDRAAGGGERSQAETDRASALADRKMSASDRDAAHLDELTGAFRRGPGFLELDREVARAARSGQPLTVAFVDVDHLKLTNDSLGHAAGDRLLRNVANALNSRLRPYDTVIRYGGDEFVCVMSGLSAVGALRRLAAANTVLGAMVAVGSFTAGVSQWMIGDTSTDLIRRADQALYAARTGATATPLP